MTSQNIRVKNLVMAALFTAIGVVLPQAFHMIPNAGSMGSLLFNSLILNDLIL